MGGWLVGHVVRSVRSVKGAVLTVSREYWEGRGQEGQRAVVFALSGLKGDIEEGRG
jgi:hypothetical protein